MRIGRTLPPAATPIGLAAFLSGLISIGRGDKELRRFQEEMKGHYGVRHCFLVSSGKAALTLILLALKDLQPERQRVILPAFTCFSVPSAVVRAGLDIGLCDQHPETFDFDFDRLPAILQPEKASQERADAEGDRPTGAARPLAVLSTHLFGYQSDVDRLRKVIADPGIAIIEDAAQAMGEVSAQGKLGTLGDVAFFSLARGKAFSTVEGGVILTNRDDLAERLAARLKSIPQYDLRSHLNLMVTALALMLLMHPRLFWMPKALPFLRLGETLFDVDFPIRGMSAFQAGLTRNWQERLNVLREGRQGKVRRLLAGLRAAQCAGLVMSLATPALIRLPIRIASGPRKLALLNESNRLGLGIMPVYPSSIDAIPELKARIRGGPFPIAAARARELVTLPTHGFLTDADLVAITELVARVSRPAF